ncbi:MAG: hypothetical protein R3F11_27005 [Verrucomicrobiales bacterium]
MPRHRPKYPGAEPGDQHDEQRDAEKLPLPTGEDQPAEDQKRQRIPAMCPSELCKKGADNAEQPLQVRGTIANCARSIPVMS